MVTFIRPLKSVNLSERTSIVTEGGVSWQIFPKRLTELTTSTDKTVSAKAMAAMMKQMKINIAEIEAAVIDSAV